MKAYIGGTTVAVAALLVTTNPMEIIGQTVTVRAGLDPGPCVTAIQKTVPDLWTCAVYVVRGPDATVFTSGWLSVAHRWWSEVRVVLAYDAAADGPDRTFHVLSGDAIRYQWCAKGRTVEIRTGPDPACLKDVLLAQTP